jgi:hypothetical protein
MRHVGPSAQGGSRLVLASARCRLPLRSLAPGSAAPGHDTLALGARDADRRQLELDVSGSPAIRRAIKPSSAAFAAGARAQGGRPAVRSLSKRSSASVQATPRHRQRRVRFLPAQGDAASRAGRHRPRPRPRSATTADPTGMLAGEGARASRSSGAARRPGCASSSTAGLASSPTAIRGSATPTPSPAREPAGRGSFGVGADTGDRAPGSSNGSRAASRVPSRSRTPTRRLRRADGDRALSTGRTSSATTRARPSTSRRPMPASSGATRRAN